MYFYQILDDNLKNIIDKNIIVYGCNSGGDFIKWFLKKYYGKDIKAFVDRWELSKTCTVLHLWSLYYIYDKNDLIINVTPYDVIKEFNDTGEDWDKTLYQSDQILNLWEKVYGGNLSDDIINYPQISYYDWLEYTYKGVDILNSVKRKFTTGEETHGYFPTDFRIFIDGVSGYDISDSDAVLDIGCGKGSGVISLKAAGFSNIGAVEYTENIFQKMNSNLEALGISHSNLKSDTLSDEGEKGIKCYQGDATLMEGELDKYNWFFLFNPFTWNMMSKVMNNICKSLINSPRKIYIFYAEPIGHQLILETKRFKISKRICNNYADASYYSYIYESI